jgi:hypothetical protein
MNIVMITSGKRQLLLGQSISTLRDSAYKWNDHTLTLVVDGPAFIGVGPIIEETTVINWKSQGASAARNIGAGSIPAYRRHENVCFFDDDVYCCKEWDLRLEEAIAQGGNFFAEATIVSGHAHPFNAGYGKYDLGPAHVEAAAVLSTVNIAMPWKVWDKVGPFIEPGGPGGSEDVDWCRRATKLGYGFAVTDPQCVIHTGLTSSSGKQIVGYEQMVEQNKRLQGLYGIKELRTV